jgi:hypothetical protein
MTARGQIRGDSLVIWISFALKKECFVKTGGLSDRRFDAEPISFL